MALGGLSIGLRRARLAGLAKDSRQAEFHLAFDLRRDFASPCFRNPKLNGQSSSFYLDTSSSSQIKTGTIGFTAADPSRATAEVITKLRGVVLRELSVYRTRCDFRSKSDHSALLFSSAPA